MNIIVDAHCDTLTAMEIQDRRLGQESERGHVDLPRLLKAGVTVQFFAAYIAPAYRHYATVRALELIDTFFREIDANSRLIEQVLCHSDLERIASLGKVAALLTIEGGEALGGRLEVLRMFYRLGVRSLTLTWNGRNELADGVGESCSGGGLTEFGVAVVKEMNRLGMMVDVSHLAEAGFRDVLRHSQKPVLASHSNSRRLCDHPRNLTDQQIKVLASSGGVMGLCFYPPFVSRENPSLERLLDHAVHIATLAGPECIGLGSDFDGITTVLPGLEDVTRLPALIEGLGRRGFQKKEIGQILGGNLLRVMKETL